MSLGRNFVHKSDIECAQFKLALKAFKNVFRFRDGHAFADYFAANYCAGLQAWANWESYMEKHQERARTAFSRKYVGYFDLPDDVATSLPANLAESNPGQASRFADEPRVEILK